MNATKSLWLSSMMLGVLLPFPAIAQQPRMQLLQGHVPAAVGYVIPVGRLEANRELKLAIGLPLRNQEELTGLLQNIYDPANPDYHHYLTPAEFLEKFGPTEKDYQAVMAFAATNGLKVTSTYSNRMLFDVVGVVTNIEKAFHVTMRTYQHPSEYRTFYAPDVEPSLNLSTPVLHITGLDNYLIPHPMVVKKNASTPARSIGATPAFGSGPDGTYMGNDFRMAYVPGSLLDGAGQNVGLLEFDDGFFPIDIQNYESSNALPNIPIKNVLLDGTTGTPGGANVEVSLDIEMAISMCPALSSVIVYEGQVTDDILNAMANDNLARQFSASWTYPIDSTTEQIFQQFAAQGQSFFNASGDGNAWCNGVSTPSDNPYIEPVPVAGNQCWRGSGRAGREIWAVDPAPTREKRFL